LTTRVSSSPPHFVSTQRTLSHCLFVRSPNHLSLHSFPTRRSSDLAPALDEARELARRRIFGTFRVHADRRAVDDAVAPFVVADRSEEHTSELQSLAYLVCRLLLEKKNFSAHPHTNSLLFVLDGGIF